MYTNVTEDFIKAISADGRTFKARFTLPSGEIIEDGIYSIRTHAQTGQSTESIEIGTATAMQIDVRMQESEIAIENNELFFEIGILLDNESYEYVPMGFFTPQKPTLSDGVMEFTAYDRLKAKMGDIYLSELVYPCDISEVCTEIENKTGVLFENKPTGITIDYRVESDDGSVISYLPPLDGYTYQEAIGIIAGRMLKYAVINRQGKIEFRWFVGGGIELLTTANGTVLTIADGTELAIIGGNSFVVDKDTYYMGANFQESIYTIGYVQAQIDNDFIIKAGSGDLGISFNGALFSNVDELEQIYESSGIAGFSYTPLNISCKGDCRLDLGDIINIQANNGKLLIAPIMSLEFTFDGGLKADIASYGSTTETANYQSPTEKAINRIYQKFAVVENLIATKSITIGDIKTTNLLDDSQTLVNKNYYYS